MQQLIADSASLCEYISYLHDPFDTTNSEALHRRFLRGCFDYARDNLALVHIFIKQPVVTKILRDQRIPIIWFVANCGGILGLCMGFSIVTVFEVLHYLFQTVFHGVQNKMSSLWGLGASRTTPTANVAGDKTHDEEMKNVRVRNGRQGLHCEMRQPTNGTFI